MKLSFWMKMTLQSCDPHATFGLSSISRVAPLFCRGRWTASQKNCTQFGRLCWNERTLLFCISTCWRRVLAKCYSLYSLLVSNSNSAIINKGGPIFISNRFRGLTGRAPLRPAVRRFGTDPPSSSYLQQHSVRQAGRRAPALHPFCLRSCIDNTYIHSLPGRLVVAPTLLPRLHWCHNTQDIGNF
jgi:hypothetical protein